MGRAWVYLLRIAFRPAPPVPLFARHFSIIALMEGNIAFEFCAGKIMYYAFSALDRGRERKEGTRIWERKEGGLWIIFRKFDEIYELHMNYAINTWQYQGIREKK